MPLECRRQALLCDQMAEWADTFQAHQTLLDLSQRWSRLAEALESLRALKARNGSLRAPEGATNRFLPAPVPCCAIKAKLA